MGITGELQLIVDNFHLGDISGIVTHDSECCGVAILVLSGEGHILAIDLHEGGVIPLLVVVLAAVHCGIDLILGEVTPRIVIVVALTAGHVSDVVGLGVFVTILCENDALEHGLTRGPLVPLLAI